MNSMKKLLMLLVLATLLVGCGKKSIIGSWAYGSYVYTFNEDKTCSYSTRKCTYEVNDNKLSILYDGDTTPFETTYEIDGDKLIIKDSFGNDIIYTRK